MIETIIVCLFIGFILGFAVGYRTPHPAEIISVDKERKQAEKDRADAEIVDTEDPLNVDLN